MSSSASQAEAGKVEAPQGPPQAHPATNSFVGRSKQNQSAEVRSSVRRKGSPSNAQPSTHDATHLSAEPGEPSADATSDLSSSSSPQKRFAVPSGDLDIDLPLLVAKNLRKLALEVGEAWFAKDIVDVDVYRLSHYDAFSRNPSSHQHFDHEAELETCIQGICPEKEYVLMLINTESKSLKDDSETSPCITLPLVISLFEKFGMAHIFLSKLAKNPGFWYQEMTPGIGKGKEKVYERHHDLCYNVPFPWLQYETSNSIFNSNAFSVSAYTKVSSSGTPIFTIYFNFIREWAVSIEEKWRKSYNVSRTLGSYPFLDHYSLLAIALSECEVNSNFSEMMYMIHGETRLATHMASPQGDLEATVRSSRNFLNTMATFIAALEAIRHVLLRFKSHMKLDNLDDSQAEISESVINTRQKLGQWNENLDGTVSIAKFRCERLVTAMQELQSLALSIVALRDSRMLRENSVEVAQLSRATVQSGSNIRVMTARMETDGRLTKVLAEITAVFLPLTALAIFFTMGFFDIETAVDTEYIVPDMPNLKYIWIYFVVTIPITFGVFFWWVGKRSRFVHEQPSSFNKERNKQQEDEQSREESSRSQAEALLSMLVRAEGEKKIETAKEAFEHSHGSVRDRNIVPAVKKTVEKEVSEEGTEENVTRQSTRELTRILTQVTEELDLDDGDIRKWIDRRRKSNLAFEKLMEKVLIGGFERETGIPYRQRKSEENTGDGDANSSKSNGNGNRNLTAEAHITDGPTGETSGKESDTDWRFWRRQKKIQQVEEC